MNSVARTLRLDGLIPCAEDWHVKLNFLDVSILYLIVMKRKYKHIIDPMAIQLKPSFKSKIK